MTGGCETAVHRQGHAALAAAQSVAVAYALFQGAWLVAALWPSAEWLLLKLGIFAAAPWLAAVGVVNARLVGLCSWRAAVRSIAPAEIGGAVGCGAAALLPFVFGGPLVLGWAVFAWASIGSLALQPRVPRAIGWVACCFTGAGGVAFTTIVVTGTPLVGSGTGLDYERYLLAMYCAHPMLLAAAVACYYATRRLSLHR